MLTISNSPINDVFTSVNSVYTRLQTSIGVPIHPLIGYSRHPVCFT
jgi:hypothetical protein